MLIKSQVLILFVLVLLFSCKTDIGDVQIPTIAMSSPNYGRTYIVGDTVFVKITFRDNIELKNGHVHMHNETMNEHRIDWFFNMTGTSYSVDTMYVIQETDYSDFTIEVHTSDLAGNPASKLVPFSAN